MEAGDDTGGGQSGLREALQRVGVDDEPFLLLLGRHPISPGVILLPQDLPSVRWELAVIVSEVEPSLVALLVVGHHGTGDVQIPPPFTNLEGEDIGMDGPA